jgi:two-component system, NarL family, sensor histidine kinase BarA
LGSWKPELAQELLDFFLTSLSAEHRLICAFYQDKNYPALNQHVHKLHGAICYLGLPRLKLATEQLETTVKNHIMSSLPLVFDQFDAEVKLLLDQYSLLKPQVNKTC